MDKKQKILQAILQGSKNVTFVELQILAEAFGFELCRVNGSHHIYKHKGIKELLNIQNLKGKAKPYQIKQFLTLVNRYNLSMEKNQ